MILYNLVGGGRSALASSVLDHPTRLLAESADGRHTEPMRGDHLAPAPAPTTRVTTFELFFDLVFVLTITRLTEVLHHEPDVIGLLTVFLILGNIWWMYAGYGWLTSNRATSSLPSRLLLFVAMGGFLVMAIATPNAFGADGLAFGLAYLVVVVVHLVITLSFQRGGGRAVMQAAVSNLGSAVLLIIAGFVEGAADWWLWGIAAALHVGLLEFGRYGSFSLLAAHFVERHSVVLIVALGESMVALGIGIGDRVLDPALLVAALMSLGLAAALWSLYFLDLDDDAERSLETAPSERVVRIAGRAFGYGFVPLLGGIVMISAGLAEVLEHPLDRLSPSGAAFLAGGAGIYILGIAAFRQAVAAAGGIQWLASGAATAVCIVAMWRGAALVALAEVALLGVILFGLAMISHRLRQRLRQDARGAVVSD
ncbi:hypothetical protein ASG80_12745 [Agromyces sp. Soil535]|nr:hypothetical protein ASG80_12745 [Agromyces sp. Soil535]